MELRQLRYFVAIVDHGSISRAANALHIAQPALTQQIHLLEDEFSISLFHRSTKGVLPTDAGKKFYDYSKAILKQVGDCKAGIAQLVDHPSGTVALGIPQSVSGTLALPLLKATREFYPDISLQLTEELPGTLIEQLHSGRINLSILFDDGQLASLATTPMVEEKLIFVTAPNSRFSPTQKTISLPDALSKTLILPSLQQGVRVRVEQLAAAAGIKLNKIIEINSIGILKSALMADLGATILAYAPLLPELTTGQLRGYEFREPKLNRLISLCKSRDLPLNSAASAIERLVLSVVSDQCKSSQWPNARLVVSDD